MSEPLDHQERKVMLIFTGLQSMLYMALTALYWGSPTFYWLMIIFFIGFMINGILYKKWVKNKTIQLSFLIASFNLFISFIMILLTKNIDSPLYPMYYLPAISTVALLATAKEEGRYMLGIAGLASVLTIINTVTSPQISSHEWIKMCVFCVTYFSLGYSVMLHNNRLNQSKYHSEIDYLTNVYNKRAGQRVLLEAYRSSRKEETPLSICFCDIDHFKEVNDQYGHLCGDEVLQRLAEMLIEHTPKNTTIIRWGGEEFLIAFKGMGQDEAFFVMEKLRLKVESYPFPYREQFISLTISCGIAEVNIETEALSDVIDKADQLLYLAKKRGRNRLMRVNQ
jgi:diguanylate cyclase (GGDEF)-like protein